MVRYNKNNVFAKIIRNELPAEKIYEDDKVLAIPDLHPQAPVHVLVIPKGEYCSFHDFSMQAPSETIAHFWNVVAKLAEKFAVDKSGYRLITNHGADALQTVEHFHVHLLGQKKLGPLIVGDNYHS